MFNIIFTPLCQYSENVNIVMNIGGEIGGISSLFSFRESTFILPTLNFPGEIMCERRHTLSAKSFVNICMTLVAYLLLLEYILIKTTIDILVYSFWMGEGPSKDRTHCTLLKMLTITNDPLAICKYSEEVNVHHEPCITFL